MNPTALVPASLPEDLPACHAVIAAQRRELVDLKAQLAWFSEQYRLAQQRRFGRSSEQLDPRQLALFEGLEPPAPEEPAVVTPPPPNRSPRGSHGGGRQRLPPNLPRTRIIHDLADTDKACPCCGQPRQVIGEECHEQLDIIPPRLQVLEQVRLTYACRHCEGQIQTPPPPTQPLPKSMASPGLLAWLVVAKYADGLPLYRLVKIFSRWGVVLSRSTLAHWMIQAAQVVQPLINLLHEQLLESPIGRQNHPAST